MTFSKTMWAVALGMAVGNVLIFIGSTAFSYALFYFLTR